VSPLAEKKGVPSAFKQSISLAKSPAQNDTIPRSNYRSNYTYFPTPTTLQPLGHDHAVRTEDLLQTYYELICSSGLPKLRNFGDVGIKLIGKGSKGKIYTIIPCKMD